MRQAPAVGVTCSGGGLWRWAQALLTALAAAVVSAWVLLLWQGPLAACALPALLAGAWAWWAATPQAVQLRWDGQAWSADGVPGQVDVMLDLQRWLLLRFRPAAGAARWLPVPDAEAGGARHALRAALYSRALPPSPPPPAPERPAD